MKITKLEIQKKNKDRVSVFVNEEYSFSIHVDVMLEYGIKTGQEISGELIEKIGADDDKKRAKEYAFNLVSSSFKSEKQIRDKMKLKGFAIEHIDNAIAILKEYKYIDDYSYAKCYTSDSINFGKMGINKIKNKLYQKGIDKSFIEEALGDLISDEQQYESALELGRRKIKTIRETDKRKRNQKLIVFLQNKGFSYDISKRVLNEINEEYLED